MSNKYEKLTESQIDSFSQLQKLQKSQIDPLPTITRVLLKPGFWVISGKDASTLHLGHLGNLYKSYESIENTGVCIAIIDDIHKPNNDSIADRILSDFIQDLNWLKLPNLKIIQISTELPRIGDYLWRLILQGKVFIQAFTESYEEIYGDNSNNNNNNNNSNNNSNNNNNNSAVNNDYNSGSCVFINDFSEIKEIFQRIVEGKPLDFDCLVLKFRLKLPEARNPLLMQVKTRKGYHFQVSLNFAIIVIDLVYGVNLLLEESRTNLFSNEIQVFYQWMFNNFTQQLPQKIVNYSYKIHNFKYFREQIQKFIDGGVFAAWDDPRLLTIAGLRRRGYTPEIIQEFCHKANQLSQVNIKLLEICAKQYLDNNEGQIQKIVAILEPIKVIVENLEPGVTEYILPSNKSFNSKNLVPFSNQVYVERSDVSRLMEEFLVTLKGGLIVKVKERVYNEMGQTATIDRGGCQTAPIDRSSGQINRGCGLKEIIVRYESDSIDRQNKGISQRKSPLNRSSSLSNDDIPWLSYESGKEPIKANFYLYSKWYLSGALESLDKNHTLEYGLRVFVYQGFISNYPLSDKIVLMNRLGYFKFDQKRSSMDGIISFNLINPLPKIEKILHNYHWIQVKGPSPP